jgi:DNA (cytosine-5)-methyltransferase 1
MALCYNRLWKLLIDRGMTRTQMRIAADISTSTLAKLSKGEDVNTSILSKICNTLNCNVGDIVDFSPSEQI